MKVEKKKILTTRVKLQDLIQSYQMKSAKLNNILRINNSYLTTSYEIFSI